MTQSIDELQASILEHTQRLLDYRSEQSRLTLRIIGCETRIRERLMQLAEQTQEASLPANNSIDGAAIAKNASEAYLAERLGCSICDPCGMHAAPNDPTPAIPEPSTNLSQECIDNMRANQEAKPKGWMPDHIRTERTKDRRAGQERRYTNWSLTGVGHCHRRTSRRKQDRQALEAQ